LDYLLAGGKAGSGDEQQQGSAHNRFIIHPYRVRGLTQRAEGC
jgi:hypothetical protein